MTYCHFKFFMKSLQHVIIDKILLQATLIFFQALNTHYDTSMIIFSLHVMLFDIYFITQNTMICIVLMINNNNKLQNYNTMTCDFMMTFKMTNTSIRLYQLFMIFFNIILYCDLSAFSTYYAFSTRTFFGHCTIHFV